MEFQWIYDSRLNLLMFLVDFKSWSVSAQKLWQNMLHSLSLTQWQAYFQGQASELKVHDFIYDDYTLDELIKHYQPRHVWLLGHEHEAMLQSPHPEDWLKSGYHKKDVWQIWQEIIHT